MDLSWLEMIRQSHPSVYNKAMSEFKRLSHWIDDLQSGMYINCVYCGHSYGPKTHTPATVKECGNSVSMAEILMKHIEICPEHPMSKLKAELEETKEALRKALEASTSPKQPLSDLKVRPVKRTYYGLNKLRARVLYELSYHSYSDGELEGLPVFRGYRPTTVGKRRTELFKMGLVESDGRHNIHGSMVNRWKLTDAGLKKMEELKKASIFGSLFG